MTRVAIAGIRHETNTYCQDTTPASAFHQRRGAAILRERDTESAAGGAMRACERLGFEVVPILIADAQPSGTIRSEAYESFRVKGASLHRGRMARLVVDGIDIVVASNRSQTFDVGPFLAVGIDVTTYPIVALKSSNLDLRPTASPRPPLAARRSRSPHHVGATLVVARPRGKDNAPLLRLAELPHQVVVDGTQAQQFCGVRSPRAGQRAGSWRTWTPSRGLRVREAGDRPLEDPGGLLVCLGDSAHAAA